MSKTYVVVGAGFRGFCDTVELIKNSGNKVHIVESAPFFGGVMNSFNMKGFYVDKGVHVFDSVPKSLGDIVSEIMDGQVSTIDFTSASVFNNKVTEGFSLPDLSSLDIVTKSKITSELITLAASGHAPHKPRTLQHLMNQRYGQTAAEIYGRIFNKVYSVDADKVEPTAMALTSLGRLKFLDDAEMMILKANPWLDNVLAARRKTLGKVDDFVSIYPSAGDAMTGWCDRTVKWLEAKGVKISLGEQITAIKDSACKVIVTTSKQTIEADYVIWANDNVEALSAALGKKEQINHLISGTPMLFLTLVTQAKNIRNFTYLQNFDPSANSYRTAASGIFSHQTDSSGNSFLTCECPTTIRGKDWENPSELIHRAWEDCKTFGIVDKDATLVDSVATRLPFTFKIPLVGYLDKVQEFSNDVPKLSQRTILRDVRPFFRRDIYLDSLKLKDVIEY